MSDVRAWVSCMSCFNERGADGGKWIEGTEAGDVVAAGLATLAKYEGTESEYQRCIRCGGDEWWVYDHEGYDRWLTGECSPMEAQRRAELIEEIESDGADPVVVGAWADNQHEITGFDWADKKSEFEDEYVGAYDSFRDYADEWADERMGAHDLNAKRPPSYDYEACARFDHIEWLTSFFDYERHARDMEFSYTTFVIDGTTHIFRDQ